MSDSGVATFDHRPTSEDLLDSLRAANADNPAAWGYRRQLERPEIDWNWLLCRVAVLLACAGAARIGLSRTKHPRSFAFVTGALVGCGLMQTRPLVLFAIRVYQRYAPAAVRENCCFEPSCSQYMSLAIEKYGLCQGVVKGIDRLVRCSPDNGGIDWP
jgi:putative component of membrane protein insertase Oxa1/YidC/SpoIIIJ protein YidD